ncbi:hypothetical protein [Paenibacillus humicola]|nr:hypothetical protein [Paenibacillus humicola]
MPSVFSGSVYHAYFIANEHNKLFRLEQRQFMQESYRTVRVDKLLRMEE